MVIDLRALGIRDFGFLLNLAYRPHHKMAIQIIDKHIENNTLHFRWHIELNTVCMIKNLAHA